MTLTAIAPRPVRYRPKTNPNCTAANHGTTAAYRWGCRCAEAREAERLYKKRRRQNRITRAWIDATGTRRRLQALCALGWRWTDLAAHFGVSYQAVQHWAEAGTTRVHADTVDRVKVVYSLLSGTPGPSATTRRRAVAKGWVPPLGWDDTAIDDAGAVPHRTAQPDTLPDEVAVELAVAGRLTWGRLNDAERAQTVRQLRATGVSISAMCAQLALSASQYRRWTATHSAVHPCGKAA